VEVVSNIVWAIAALGLVVTTYCGVRRGFIRLSMSKAMTLAVLLCFFLLPVISVTDDVLQRQQNGFPLSSQTWRLVSESVSAGSDLLLTVGTILLLLMSFLVEARLSSADQWDIRPLAERLARSQRLRPPPCAA